MNAKVEPGPPVYGIKTVTHDEDSALLSRVAARDREAFETLFHRYQPRISRFAARLTSRRDIVEEAVNDTMFVVWQKANRFRGDSRVSSWIFGIAYRTTLKKLRKSSRREEQELSSVQSPIDHEEPEFLLSRRQTHDRIHRALLRLTPEHRAVVELTFFEGLSYREIAKIVGCPQNTVKTRMFHARRRLKRVLATLPPPIRSTRSQQNAN